MQNSINYLFLTLYMSLIMPLDSFGPFSLKLFSFFTHIISIYSMHQHKTTTSQNCRVAVLGLSFTISLPCSVCLYYWQHSGRLMSSMDQPLMFFIVWLESFAWSVSFSPQVVLAQESNLTATSSFFITLKTTEDQSKAMWHCEALQVIELFFIFF